MISDTFLKILQCPIAKEPLQLADEQLLAQVNQFVSERKLADRAGDAIADPLEAGLVNQSRTLLYRIEGDIPNLIADDAIPLDQLTRGGGQT